MGLLRWCQYMIMIQNAYYGLIKARLKMQRNMVPAPISLPTKGGPWPEKRSKTPELWKLAQLHVERRI